MQNDIKHKLLELYDFCPNAAARFPPSIRVKTGVSFSLNRDTRWVAFHVSIEYPAYSSGVVSSDDENNGLELVLIAPWRKNLYFTSGSSFGSGYLHDIGYVKRT